jgi:hypothetical protein
LISVHHADPFIALYNPSMLSPDFHTSLAANFTDYFSNAGYGSFVYAHHFKKAGSFAFSLQTVGYGSFTQTDESGNTLGSFTAVIMH